MKNVLIFLAGAAVGGVATWKLIEKHYNDLADEEIQSVIEAFKKREDEEKKKHIHLTDTEEAKEYIKENYGTEEEIAPAPKKTKKSVKIEIIAPEEYGALDDYSTKSYTYYNNNVLVDDFDTPIGNPDVLIGDALDHFGEYEDDSVYVRNTKFKTDYEILKSEKDFVS